MAEAGKSQSLTAAERKVEELIDSSGIMARTRVITSLNSQINRPDFSQEEWTQQVAADRELAAKVLLVANSVTFGARSKIVRIDEAFGRLGMNEFYQTVVVASLRLALGEAGPLCTTYWGHIDTIARLNSLLAPYLLPGSESPSFLIGMLHDCAVPLMAHHLVDYSYLATEAIGMDPNGPDTELECYAMNHTQTSMALARRWGFPSNLVSAIPFHHQATLVNAPVESRPLLGILLLSRRIISHASARDGVLFCSEEDQRLVGELASAFRVEEDLIRSVAAEMDRLFQMRQRAA
jgi:HD-like signal output (HDOD) protein